MVSSIDVSQHGSETGIDLPQVSGDATATDTKAPSEFDHVVFAVEMQHCDHAIICFVVPRIGRDKVATVYRER
jgi:hypothetical protein